MRLFSGRSRCIDRSRLFARLHQDTVVFLNYPFPPASVFPDGLVRAGQVKDIDPVAVPPEVRLKTGEILFAWNVSPRDMEGFARNNQIPLVQRRDNWCDLLAPYLDLEFSEPEQLAAIRRLEKQGFTRPEIEKIRRSVDSAMRSYNSVAWKDNHLGLAELLEAVGQKSYAWRFKRFYHNAMTVSNRGTKATVA